VERDRELDVLDAVGSAGVSFLLFNRPRSVTDVGLAVAEQHEPVAGPGAVHRDRDIRGNVVVEELGDEPRSVMVPLRFSAVELVSPPPSSSLQAAATSASTAIIARTSRPSLRFPIGASLSSGPVVARKVSSGGERPPAQT